jgi:hypothetical protein
MPKIPSRNEGKSDKDSRNGDMVPSNDDHDKEEVYVVELRYFAQ